MADKPPILTVLPASDAQAAVSLEAVDSVLKGSPTLALDGIHEDTLTEEQDIAARQEAWELMQAPLPPREEVDRNYLDPTAIGDPGEHLQGKSLAKHEPQSVVNERLRKMMPKGWTPPPVQPPQPGDVEFLQFWDAYFAETGDVPTWTELEEYDRIRRRAYGSPGRSEKTKRRGFQVTGRYCKKPGCGGEVRYDPDQQIETCFGCLETTVIADRQLRRR